MNTRRMVAALAVTVIAFSACGGDEDDAAVIDEPDTAEVSDVVITTDPPAGGGATEQPEVPAAGADGTGTFTAGDVTIEGSGSLADPGAQVDDFTLTAQIGAC